MAVYDAANHAETSQTLAQTLKIFDQARQQVQQLTSVVSTLGTFGSSSSAGVVSSALRTVHSAVSVPPMRLDRLEPAGRESASEHRSLRPGRAFGLPAVGVD